MADPNEFENARDAFMETLRRMGVPAGAAAQPANEPEEDEPSGEVPEKHALEFSLKPKEVKAYLDRFVIQQDEAKRVLATAVCDHYNYVRTCKEGEDPCPNYVKHNILMLGPTGVGKTYLIRKLADLIGVPFVKADATKFSETGYVGGDVDDLVRDLVHKADGDVELAQYGMVYIDEVDKIASASDQMNKDVSGSGVQRGLLKLMEESEVSARNPQDIQAQVQGMLEFQQKGKMSKQVINTRHVLFIVSGAFNGLNPIIQRRLREGHLGFASKQPKSTNAGSLVRMVATEDLVRYGFEPEFVGRLPVRVVCDALNTEDFYAILTQSEGSILRQYRAAFEAYGIHLDLEDEAVWALAQQAAAEKTGARGLVSVCERVFRDFKFELPSTAVRVLHIDAQAVADPGRALAKVMEDAVVLTRQDIEAAVDAFRNKFELQYALKIDFDAEARAFMAEQVNQADDLDAWLKPRLENFPYGLELIQRHTQQDRFLITRAVLQKPQQELDAWIKAVFSQDEGAQRGSGQINVPPAA